eukprot:15080881-Alexandrium_andersonii.AAC.1
MILPTHSPGNMRPWPKHSPWYLHQCADPLRLRAALSSITACSHASPEVACARTPAPPVSDPMSGRQIETYVDAPGLSSSGLRSGQQQTS